MDSIAALAASSPILSALLAAMVGGFAATTVGALPVLFVISDEVIPETHRAGFGDSATAAMFVGFGLMFFLDVAMG